MNNKGFTLIELLATITLLAIISVISFVSINKILEDSKIKDCENLVSNITSATKEYVSDNRYGSITTSITAQILIDNKYLKGPIVNPFDNNMELDPEKIYINIELDDDYTPLSIKIVNSLNEELDCSSTSVYEYYSNLGAGNSNDDDINGETGGLNPDAGTNPGETNNQDTRDIEYINKFPVGGICATGIDEFYKKDGVTYYYTCQMRSYIYISVDGVEYSLVEALENDIVSIDEVVAAAAEKNVTILTKTSDFDVSEY